MADPNPRNIKINIKTNINQVLKEFQDIRSRDLPRQYGFALNDTARSLMRILNARTSKFFHKPIFAFTKQAFGYVRSTSKQKTINQKKPWVGVKGAYGVPANAEGPKKEIAFNKAASDRAKALFELQIYGGQRQATDGSNYLVKPSGHTKEVGGMTAAGGLDKRKWLPSVTNNKAQYFSGIPKGGAQGENFRGLWERYADNTRIRMVAKYDKTANYQPLFPYDEILNANYGKIITANWRKQLSFLRRKAKTPKYS